jgi:hypothetical protein
VDVAFVKVWIVQLGHVEHMRPRMRTVFVPADAVTWTAALYAPLRLNQPEAHCGVPAFTVAGHVESATSVMPAVPSMFVAEKAAKEKSTDAVRRAIAKSLAPKSLCVFIVISLFSASILDGTYQL